MNEKAPLKCGVSGSGDFDLYCDWNHSNLYRTEAENMIYLQLFFSFLQVGLFSFGGGYAAMPLIQEQIVTKHGWLNMVEFTDLISISQMTPGPIAVNSATFVGNKIAGITGALVATAGCIFPSCIILIMCNSCVTCI